MKCAANNPQSVSSTSVTPIAAARGSPPVCRPHHDRTAAASMSIGYRYRSHVVRGAKPSQFTAGQPHVGTTRFEWRGGCAMHIYSTEQSLTIHQSCRDPPTFRSISLRGAEYISLLYGGDDKRSSNGFGRQSRRHLVQSQSDSSQRRLFANQQLRYVAGSGSQLLDPGRLCADCIRYTDGCAHGRVRRDKFHGESDGYGKRGYRQCQTEFGRRRSARCSFAAGVVGNDRAWTTKLFLQIKEERARRKPT